MMAQLPALWLLALSLAAPASAILVVDDRPALGGVLYAVGLALGVSAEWLLHRMEPTHRVLESVHLGFAVRSGLRDLSLLVLVAVWARPDTDLVVAVTMAVVLVAVARVSVAALVNTSARLRDRDKHHGHRDGDDEVGVRACPYGYQNEQAQVAQPRADREPEMDAFQDPMGRLHAV